MLNVQLAYLPHRRKDLILDDENNDLYLSPDGNSETGDDTFKEEKKSRKHGLLNWFLRVSEFECVLIWFFISNLYIFYSQSI